MAMRLSHAVIKSLYETLRWYSDHRGALEAARVLQLFETWRGLHASFINISKEGWDALRRLAHNLQLQIGGRDDEWLFLFAVETYLNLAIRAITLAKLGRVANSIDNFVSAVSGMNVFERNVFEWVFDALRSPTLDAGLRQRLQQNIDALLDVIASLNLLGVAFDTLREVYQNVLPREVRRSIGEFYTSDELVDVTLDAAGLDDRAVRELYERWKQGMRDVVILDPACGSGSFLVAAIRRILGAFGDKLPADIASFVEENVIGIDVNPFAVEMARLNVIATISEEMRKRGGAYVPQKVQIYWADSLARVRNSESLYYKSLKIDVPALQQAIGVGHIEVSHCSGVGPLEVLDEVVKLAEGSSLGELAERIAERCGVRPDLVRQGLERLYSAVRRILESGNGRVVAAIKNTLAVHDLLGRCSYVIGNPPWVRIHRIDANVRKYVTESYSWVGRDCAFNPGFKLTRVPFARQIDYSVAFVQRGLEFLREGGALAYVITSQVARATYAGRMREELLRYTLLRMVDYSLYPIPLFPDAVNYPLVIVVKKSPPPRGHKVRVTVYNTGGDHRDFELEQDALPLYAGTKYPNARRSPWVLAPPEVRSAVQKIIASGQRLGDIYEVMMGIKTSLNEQYIGTLAGCDKARGIVKLQLEGGRTVDVEEFLVHPFVRGEGIDPYSYKWDELVIFPHDVNTLEPLWDPDQRRVLELLGLLGRGVRVSASGGMAVYEVSLEQPLACNRVGAYVRDVEQRLRGAGFDAQRVSPCGVDACLKIADTAGREVLQVSLGFQCERHGSQCACNAIRCHIVGLRVPGASLATRHFSSALERLVKRDDYKPELPPWAVFRVSRDKFEGYRVAWQEIAKHLEAVCVPARADIDLCGKKAQRLIVLDTTAHFIVEKNPKRALRLLVYLNSDVARALVKLWARVMRGGHYRHKSVFVGMLPAPKGLLDGTLWAFLDGYLEEPDLNAAAVKAVSERGREIVGELLAELKITESEYRALVEWSRWLNEIAKPPKVEVPEEEEEGDEEE
ncbi:MAG: Eco57I restriction-modification methylase domain-containing protein [Pyrobaculum sp.]|jgi:hypothetical protein